MCALNLHLLFSSLCSRWRLHTHQTPPSPKLKEKAKFRGPPPLHPPPSPCRLCADFFARFQAAAKISGKRLFFGSGESDPAQLPRSQHRFELGQKSGAGARRGGGMQPKMLQLLDLLRGRKRAEDDARSAPLLLLLPASGDPARRAPPVKQAAKESCRVAGGGPEKTQCR